MNNPMAPGWGPCGLCGRNLHLMTPVTSVTLPGSRRAVMTCKDCPDRRAKLEKIGLVAEPEILGHPVVVSDPAVFAAPSLKVELKKESEPEPSKPVKEQTGTRRRTKKEAPKDEADGVEPLPTDSE